MGFAKGLMENCSSLFATVRDCSPALALFGLFATVLSLYNEQSNNSPLRIPLNNSKAWSKRLFSHLNHTSLGSIAGAYRDCEAPVET
jgi:hypothetical protein